VNSPVSRLRLMVVLALAAGHRAVHADALLPMRGAGSGKACRNQLFAGDIDAHEQPVDGSGNFAPRVLVHIENRDFCACSRQCLRRRAAQPRCGARDNRSRVVIDFHALPLL